MTWPEALAILAKQFESCISVVFAVLVIQAVFVLVSRYWNT